MTDLMQRPNRFHGAEPAGSWSLKAGFGPCTLERRRVFATLTTTEK